MQSGISGTSMFVKISATKMTAPADGVKIDGLSKNDFKKTAEVLDITSFGDLNKVVMGGLKSGSLSLSGSLAIDDAGQLLLEPGDMVYIAMYPQGLSKAGKQGYFLVTELEWTAEVAGKQEFSCSLELSGATEVIQ